jgi:hypothetical protein
MRAAIAIAVAADVLQWCFGPFGWVGADQVIDVATMLLTIALLGFHPLLLPAAFMEFLPGLDMLPTWTGCVLVVIARMKKLEEGETPITPAIVEPPPLLPPAKS